jgi:hypothetical protein
LAYFVFPLKPNSADIVALDQTPWSGAMQDYRAYVVGVDGHRFIRVKDFLSNHPDDAAALKAVQEFTDKSDVEIWESGRLVARLESVALKSTPPELAPPLAVDTPSASGRNPVKETGPISLSNVSELASGVSPESNPFSSKFEHKRE